MKSKHVLHFRCELLLEQLLFSRRWRAGRSSCYYIADHSQHRISTTKYEIKKAAAADNKRESGYGDSSVAP